MKNLQNFLWRLRRNSGKQRELGEDAKQRADTKVGIVVPLRTGTSKQRQRANELCAPNETDYDQAERLRDPEYGYEFALWRLW